MTRLVETVIRIMIELLFHFPLLICLLLRGAEAVKIFDEMSSLTGVGLVAWMCGLLFVGAVVVTLFGVDDKNNLKWWEIIIETASSLATILLTWECTFGARAGLSQRIPVPARFMLFLTLFIALQLGISFASRRVPAIAIKAQRSIIPMRFRRVTAKRRSSRKRPNRSDISCYR